MCQLTTIKKLSVTYNWLIKYTLIIIDRCCLSGITGTEIQEKNAKLTAIRKSANYL